MSDRDARLLATKAFQPVHDTKKRMTNRGPRSKLQFPYWGEFLFKEGNMVKKRPLRLVVLALALVCCFPYFAEAG